MEPGEFSHRVRATVRLLWRHGLIVVCGLIGASLLLRLGLDYAETDYERGFLLLLTATAVTLVAQSGITLLTRSESYLQGSYTERAKAVQDLLAHARAVKSTRVEVLRFGVLPPTGTRPPLDHHRAIQASEAACDELLTLAWHHRVWVGRRGEKAVRRFLATLEGLTPLRPTEAPTVAEARVAKPFRELEMALMGDLGFWPS